MIKAPILGDFNQGNHIKIETDASGYIIGGVLSQELNELTIPDFGQWNLIGYILINMILVKTQYKTHNAKLLPIEETFKNWRYYLKDYKYEVLVVINNYNFYCFMDPKSLSS